ncbi:MAG: 50S ribosomal protein L11 methyltransferase [Parcubacteria group bacterium]
MIEIIITYFILFLAFALLLGSAVFMFYRTYAMISGAPYAGTKKVRVQKMIELADLQKGQKVVDLGSGDGRILIAAARAADVKCVGYELDFLMWLWSIYKVKRAGLSDRIKIYRRSYWPADLKEFDIVFLFLIPYKMGRMEKKLQSELRPGTQVISHGFKFPNWQPEKKEERILVYQMTS